MRNLLPKIKMYLILELLVTAVIGGWQYYQKGADKKPESDEGKASISELIVAKHRNGNIKTIKLVFKGDTCSFLNYQEENE